MKRRLVLCLMMLFLITVWGAGGQWACGPFFPAAFFTYAAHPEFPLEQYVAGQLGVVPPSYARSYLVVAYRYLNDQPLDSAAQMAMLALWQRRLDSNNFNQEADIWADKWNTTRRQIIQVELPANSYVAANKYVSGEGYFVTYVNCKADAFRTALDTLARRQRLANGAQDAELMDWIKAQDQVFANCNNDKEALIPAMVLPTSSAMHQADRQYQIAAANFYAGNLDTAIAQFTAIAQDNSSPWQPIAPYLAARSFVRKASFYAIKNKNAIDQATYDQAQQLLAKLLQDNNRQDLHPAAQRLQNLITLRIAPQTALQQNAQNLTQVNGADFARCTDDYTYLLDSYLTEGEFEGNEKPAQAAKLEGTQDLNDWILAMQQGDLEFAAARWQKTGSKAWLVAALTKAAATTADAILTPLMQSATIVPATHPAFASVQYHLVRLLIDQGKTDAARNQLDKLLVDKQFNDSSTNLFLALRLRLARNLAEFVQFAPRKPLGVSFDIDGREFPEEKGTITVDDKEVPLPERLLDFDAALLINRGFPLAIISQLARNQQLPENLRREILIAAWVRAILLDKEDIAQELTPQLLKSEPRLQSLLQGYLKAKTIAERRFAAIFALLQYPVMQPSVDANLPRTTAFNEIDSYRDNWWCKFNLELPSTQEVEGSFSPNAANARNLLPVAFLTTTERQQAVAEFKQLTTLETAPNYFCQQVLAWAKLSPKDPRVPEALHLAVRATRYGCTDEQTLRASKAAFQWLHKYYPTSPWTKKTPYFFGN